MGNIVLLDELTINKIAAGEVIERPASVIKEMVENSIDAGATSVSVEIKNGGISYIRITDNGKGIMPDDMEIAFERHATSKIRIADDLNNIKSMGFRGEALASIAAVSNVEMISRIKDSEIGNKIVVEAGKVLEKEETGCPIGTSITVRNLFFNTPVRYKFLKKDFTESGYIEDAITRLALVNPNIAFKLINSGKVILQTSGNGDMKSVIYSIYGKDIAEGILEVNYVYEDIYIRGVVGKPEIARSNRANQLFFVNKRFIKDKTLSSATEKAFKGMLPIGKYAFLVLNLDINPNKVDVNVHPAKLEVRFEEESKVFKSIYHAIQDTLLKNDLIANTEKEKIDINNRIDNQTIEINNEQKSTGLFRNKLNEEKNDNVIESVYNSRMNIINKEEVKDTSKEQTIDNNKPEDNVVVKKLIELQRKMQEELEKNKKELERKSKNIEEKKDEVIENEEDEKKEIDVDENKEKEIQLKEKINSLENNKIEDNTNDFEEMYVKTFRKTSN